MASILQILWYVYPIIERGRCIPSPFSSSGSTDMHIHEYFVINRVSMTPAAINLSNPRNHEKSINIQLVTGDDTDVNNPNLNRIHIWYSRKHVMSFYGHKVACAWKRPAKGCFSRILRSERSINKLRLFDKTRNSLLQITQTRKG